MMAWISCFSFQFVQCRGSSVDYLGRQKGQQQTELCFAVEYRASYSDTKQGKKIYVHNLYLNASMHPCTHTHIHTRIQMET